MLRAIFVSVLVIAGFFACDDSSDGDDKAEEAVRAVERAQREAAKKVEKKVEQVGEVIRENTEDGSMLVETPGAADSGD